MVVLAGLLLSCRLATADPESTFVDRARNISFSYDGFLWHAANYDNPTIVAVIREGDIYKNDIRCELRAYRSDFARPNT